ncbi:MAG: glycerate kinase [Limisphaerales bacterium]
MRVLIAPDKFKGTLAADAVARAIAQGWRRIRPKDDLVLLPISDGGDGFGAVLGGLLGARNLAVATVNALGRPHRSRIGWVEKSRLALIEAAQSNGLALLPAGNHHPFQRDTLGVARLIEAARRKGARHMIIGVGGSATNDGGFGMARGLGWRFLDSKGRSIDTWTGLDRLARLEGPPEPEPEREPASRRVPCRYTVATDVENPLLGPEGATRVYGPQKGLVRADLAVAEKCLRRLARVVRDQLGFDSATPGSGAAGGLGFGLMAFLGAERRLGFDVFAEYAGLERHLRNADLVITGEGSFDRQSVMGKGVGQWIRRCADRKRPVLVLAGRVALESPESLPPGVTARGLCDITSPAEAMERPAFWLRRLAAGAASDGIGLGR